MGHREARWVPQVDNLDSHTRTQLWNVTNTLQKNLERAEYEEGSTAEARLLRAIWTCTWQRAADEQPSARIIWERVKNSILRSEWFDALDIIEQIVGYTERFKDFWTSELVAAITAEYNDCFEKHLVAFRFIDLRIAPISNTLEAEAVSGGIDDTASIEGARHHLERAVELLSNRQRPDYPNSIKESISAVESVCRSITGEGTLGNALKKLETSGVKFHKALRAAWSSMYGWTSDGNGIRHGTVDTPDTDQALAKYMLVTCSAFVSYLIEEGPRVELV